MKKINPVFVLIMILLFSGSSFAEEDALSIIRKVDEKQKADTSKSKMSMIVFPDMYDEKNSRKFNIISYGKGEDYGYMEFVYPKTIKGLRILSRKGDIWAYFSSTGRVRKIAGKSKSKSVAGVGGDFSYEDMGGGKIEEDYTLKVTKSDSKEWVIQGIPKKKDISYSKALFAISKDKYLPTKIEYYKKDKLFKTLTFYDIKELSGREMSTRMEMVNHKKESKTVILIHAMEYDKPIDKKYFNPSRFYK